MNEVWFSHFVALHLFPQQAFNKCLKVTIIMMKHHEQKQAPEEMVYLVHLSVIEGGQDRNSSRAST